MSASDELAGVDILCSDKTGTLTQNKLTLSSPISFSGTRPADIVLGAALATKANSEDAIDRAVLKAAPDAKALAAYRQTELVPFDPVNKRTMTTVVDPQGKTWRHAKGAPQAISALCKLDAATEDAYDAKVADLAKHGYRALGVASSADDGRTWKLLGLLSLLDPPRPDAASTIAETKKLGLEVKMVTGDDVAIGSEISSQLGLGTHLLVASGVFRKGSDPDHIPLEATQAVENADGFGRVFPEHKYGIVKSLQQTGHIVAMTGDGVNDAPALKQADCGIAVSGATDAARSAAALILTQPGPSTIVGSIVEARKISECTTSYIYYRIAITTAIMLVVVMSSVIFNIHPLTAIMIVALPLLDDIPIMTIAYDNVRTGEAPVRWDMHRILIFSGLMGLMATAQSFGLVLLGMEWMNEPELLLWINIDHQHLQTMLFFQLASGGRMLLFVVRSRRWMNLPPWPSAPLFFAVVATQVVAVLMCAYGVLVPALPWPLIGVVWAYVIGWTILTDITKLIFNAVAKPSKQESPLTALTAPIHWQGCRTAEVAAHHS